MEEKIQLTEGELHVGGDGVKYLQDYKDVINSTWCENTKPDRIHRPLINVANHLGNLQYAVWGKMKQIAPYTPVTLDPRTAGLSVRVSSELSSFHISRGPSQRVEQHMNKAFPVGPNLLHPHPCILARETFNTGVHYWDIEVGHTNEWTVGVAAPSALRMTAWKACPEAGLWCISLKDGQYRALTTPTQMLDLDRSHHLTRVCVRLDVEGGTVDFIDPDTDAVLFTFTHCCMEAIYPYFESSSEGSSVAVLEQTVKINVSDYPLLKDSVTILEDNKSTELCSMTEETHVQPIEKEKTSNTINGPV